MGLAKKLLTLAAVAALIVSSGPAAMAGEALLNSEVEVDQTGKDAADARDQAMVKGQADALAALLSKLTTPDQVQTIVMGLDAQRIASMVRGTEVLDEKISEKRYRAHLLVTFDGDAISQLISGGTSADEQKPIGAFLIIPSYDEDGTVMLWEEGNPWRSAWKSTALEFTSGDIVVPFGDNNDVAIVDARTAASANYASLTPMISRYGVSDIVIVQAKYMGGPDMGLTVVKRRINRSTNEVNLINYRADPQETKDMLLARAARDIAQVLEAKKVEELQTAKAVQGGEHHQVMMLASVTTLASWTELRGKLTAMPMVDKLEVIAMSPQQVDLVLHYRGSPESLVNAINANHIRLVQNPNYWVISRD